MQVVICVLNIYTCRIRKMKKKPKYYFYHNIKRFRQKRHLSIEKKNEHTTRYHFFNFIYLFHNVCGNTEGNFWNVV